jgi:hypothetical protein
VLLLLQVRLLYISESVVLLFFVGGDFQAKQLSQDHLPPALQSKQPEDTAAARVSKRRRTSKQHDSPSKRPAAVQPREQEDEKVNIYEDTEEQDINEPDLQPDVQPQQSDQPSIPINVPQNIKLVKDSAQKLNPKEDFLLLAAISNQPGWDAMLVVRGKVYVLQMTVGMKHPVQMQAVVDLLRRFTSEPSAKYLCFVLPEERYWTYTAQAWQTKKDEQAARLHPELHNVIQLGVLIDDKQLRRRAQEDVADAHTEV